MEEYKIANHEKLQRVPSGYNLWLKDNKDRIKIIDSKFSIGEYSAKAHVT